VHETVVGVSGHSLRNVLSPEWNGATSYWKGDSFQW